MPLPVNRVTGDTILAADINAIATVANAALPTATASATYLPKVTGTPEVVIRSGTPIDPTVPKWSVVDGTSASPKTNTGYKTPVTYIERHTNTSTVTGTADWGNDYRSPTTLTEVVVGTSEVNEIVGGAVRIVASGANPSTGAGIIGFATQVESTAGSGVRARDVFGANFACVVDAGTPPTNVVGMEVDMVPRIALTSTVRPGVSGYQNWTGLMVQSAGTDGTTDYASNTGLWLSSVTHAGVHQGGPGYYYGIVAECWFQNWIGYFKNTLNQDGAGGLYLETQWATASTKILNCFVAGSTEQLRLTGDTSNPFWVRIGGSLHQIVQQTTTGTTSGFTAGSGTAMNSASTSTGATGTAAYTFGDVVFALKQLGLIAA